MKKLIAVSWLLLVLALSAAAEADLTPLIGAWVNPEYNSTREPPKFVIKADGTIEQFGTTYDTTPCMLFSYTIEEAWQDAEGAYWYKMVAVKIQTLENYFWYLLIRVSPDGSSYEEDYIRGNLREFATVINPESYFYKILYRE